MDIVYKNRISFFFFNEFQTDFTEDVELSWRESGGVEDSV